MALIPLVAIHAVKGDNECCGCSSGHVVSFLRGGIKSSRRRSTYLSGVDVYGLSLMVSLLILAFVRLSWIFATV